MPAPDHTRQPHPDLGGERAAGHLTRAALRCVAADWRPSVSRDLDEEADRAGHRGWRRDVWCAWQILRVGVRLRARGGSGSHAVAARVGLTSAEDRAPMWTRLVGSAALDARLALRMLRRRPASAVTIVAMLALGIGASTATFAVFNFVLFRPVPGVSDADRLVTVRFQPHGQPRSFGSGPRTALPALRQAATELDGLGESTPAELPLSTAPGSGAELGSVEFVTSQYLHALGVRARVGRLLTDREADAGDEVALVSDRLRGPTSFGAPVVLGGSLVVNGHVLTVVGVIADYRGWGATRMNDVDVWLPAGAATRVTNGAMDVSTMFGLVGRLREGGSLGLLEERLRAAYTAATPATPATPATRPGRRVLEPVVYSGLTTISDRYVHDHVMQIYWILMGAAGLLLLLACANAANLLLARALERQRETAVRHAIGASRWRIVRQFLVEASVLAVAAAAAGLALAAGIARVFQGLRLMAFLPPLQAIDIDRRVGLFCVAVATVTVVAFGVAPAVLASRANAREALGSGGRATVDRRRLRLALASAQVALSLVLMIGAAVLNRSLANLLGVDLGMRVDHVVALSLKPYKVGYDDTRSKALIEQVRQRLREAGLGEVAFASPAPLDPMETTLAVSRTNDGTFEPLQMGEQAVSPEYFDVLHIPIRSGRTFTEAERSAPRPVGGTVPMIANETMARELFGAAPAVGRRFGVDWSGDQSAPVDAVIIGVVGDTKTSDVKAAAVPRLYDTTKTQLRGGTLVMASPMPVAEAMAICRRIVHDVDPALPIDDLRPLEADVTDALGEARVLARLGLLIALMAGILAASGVLAVIAELVVARAREFGIRLALGASPTAIAGLVLRGVWAICGIGCIAGLALYQWTSRLIAAHLFGITRFDVTATAGACALLFGAALVAAWAPASRAMRIDPIEVLRQD
jgi:predicted permease